MTRKDYAISLGLAKPGRGRMSKEAHAAIALAESQGMVFEEGSSITIPNEPVFVSRDTPPGITGKYTGFTKSGLRIAFSDCSACKQRAAKCSCPNGILAPAAVISLT